MALPEIIKDINDQVSAVDPNGDTMIGTLRIQKKTWPQLLLEELTIQRHAVNEIDTEGRYVISCRANTAAVNGTYLFLDKETQPLDNIIRFGRNINGVWEEYKIIHTGNKNLITADDIGASRAHKGTWDFTQQHHSNEVTFDVSNAPGMPTEGWVNGFVSTHNNYLSSYIVNAHRTSNWYVGYGETVGVEPTWYKLLHSGNYSEYALPLSGNVTMAGSIKWGNNRGIGPAASVTDLDIYAGRVSIRLEPANISGYDLKNCIFIRDTGTGQTYKFYGEHNKPTASDVGAISQSEMPLITVIKSITLTTDWQDTGIAFNNVSGLETGTYAIQISGISSGISGLWGDIFSGVMSWYNGNTNGDSVDEIMLHSAGHSRTGNFLFLRIIRHFGNTINVKLQIKATANASSAANITFKFRRLI